MEKERAPQYEIRKATVDDVEAIRRMQAQSCCDTYQNDELGVTAKWLKDITQSWLTPEALQKSRKFLEPFFSHNQHFYTVALLNNEVVGFIHLDTKENGSKHLWGLYTDISTHGTGVAQKLMTMAEEWVQDKEVELEVASYNERAKAFYRKHGFVEQDGIVEMFENKIPSVRMVRKSRSKK